ncbi:MAG: hypothetical protein RRA92_09095 [Gemmatimonadota bacterium]|nr:hypothetical protein [Gemmatimonadota bacterium]
MQIDTTTDALLCAIRGDVRRRVDRIVTEAETATRTLASEQEIDRVLDQALRRVESAIGDAARAMAREIQRDRGS